MNTQAQAASHTPTPLRIINGSQIAQENVIVAETFGKTWTKKTERAALIVRAVNSHAALILACSDLLDVLLTSKGRNPYPVETECYIKIEQARAALELARKGGVS